MEQEPQFASQGRVNAHPELKKRFIRRVLELPWAFVSDESSLLDFGGDTTGYLGRIKELYGIDASDIRNGNLADILERIASEVPDPE